MGHLGLLGLGRRLRRRGRLRRGRLALARALLKGFQRRLHLGLVEVLFVAIVVEHVPQCRIGAGGGSPLCHPRVDIDTIYRPGDAHADPFMF